MTDKQSMRLAWDISENFTIGLIIYESETEHSFRTYLLELVSHYSKLFVFPVNERAHRHLQTTCGPILNYLKAPIVDTLEIEVMADEIILFRVVEEFMSGRKANVRIVDPANRWLSRELSGIKSPNLDS